MEKPAVPHDVAVGNSRHAIIILDYIPRVSHDSYGKSVNYHVYDPIWRPLHKAFPF